MDDEVYESVILVKPEVHVYRIPPRTSNRAVKASDWNLSSPDWTGRLRVFTRRDDSCCYIKLEDKISGELFAKCPIDSYPGNAVESVQDSSRYFVIRIISDTGRSAFIGLGFVERGDSFDFNVALQDHFQWIKKSRQLQEEDSKPGIHQDYTLKEGQTIKINVGKLKKPSNVDEGETKKTRPAVSGGVILPPPIAPRLAPPRGTTNVRLKDRMTIATE